MNSIRSVIGSLIFWICWPLFYVYLNGSDRTRLLIVVGDKLLFIQNTLGIRKYTLPGGGVHNHEDPRQAIIREAREEVGIDLKINQLHLIKSDQMIKEIGFKYRVTTYYIKLPSQFKPKLQRAEILSGQWLDWREQIKGHKISHATEQILNAWISIEHLLD